MLKIVRVFRFIVRIAKIRVNLEGVSHTCFNDLDVLLVAPNGQSLVLTSDAGGCGGTAAPTRLTFDDYAPTTLNPAQAQPPSGSYRPSDLLRSLFVYM